MVQSPVLLSIQLAWCAGLVNRNLNLILFIWFILDASCITLSQSCVNIILTFSYWNRLDYSNVTVIGFSLTTVWLLIVIVKMYLFCRRRKKDAIILRHNNMIIDQIVVLGLIMIIIGVLTTSLSIFCQFWVVRFDHVKERMCMYDLLGHSFPFLSLLFGCVVILFDTVSVMIPQWSIVLGNCCNVNWMIPNKRHTN